MSWDSDDFEPPSVFQASVPDTSRWVDDDKEVKDEKPQTKDDKLKKEPTKKVSKKDEKAPPPIVPKEPLTKAEQQKLVEAADLENVTEMFGGVGSKDILVDIVNPKDEKDFEFFAESLANKAIPFDKSFHYKFFLKKSFIKKATINLKTEDLKDLATVLNLMANEKLKSEKPVKKKKAVAKKQVNVRGNGDYDEFMMDNDYEEED